MKAQEDGLYPVPTQPDIDGKLKNAIITVKWLNGKWRIGKIHHYMHSQLQTTLGDPLCEIRRHNKRPRHEAM